MASLERPRNWRDLAAGFVLNNLSDEEVMLWTALCTQDPQLIEEAKQLQQTFNHFADIIPLHAPSHSLVETVRLRAKDDLGCLGHNGKLPKSSGIPSRDRRSRWQWLGIIVSGVAIACLGTQVYLLNDQVQHINQQLEALQHQLQDNK